MDYPTAHSHAPRSLTGGTCIPDGMSRSEGEGARRIVGCIRPKAVMHLFRATPTPGAVGPWCITGFALMHPTLEAAAGDGEFASHAKEARPQKRRPRLLLSQSRGDTMVVRQFVLRAPALIRGTPVRRHPAKLSLERLWLPAAELRRLSPPLFCDTAAEHARVRFHPLSRAPAVLDPAWACRLPCEGATPLPVLVAPLFQRRSNPAYQWGHPVARPATVSSLDRFSMPETLPAAIAWACGNC